MKTVTGVRDHGVDAGIATLAAVLEAGELGRHLRPALPVAWGAVRDVQVQVLQHHLGKRCTVRIGLCTTSGWHDLIGKVYAKDRPDVYAAMDALRNAGFGPDDEFSIPQPLAYVPTLRLLVQEQVHGTAAKTIFLADVERRSGFSPLVAAERSALWLARFQATAPQCGPVFDARRHLMSLARWSSSVAALGGPFMDKSCLLFKRLDVAVAALSSSCLCASHGSYGPAHVLLAGDRTVTIDWDGYDVADPARDVARFVVALERLALGRLGSIRALDTVAAVFEETYVAVGRPEVVAGLPFYKAATCLQLAAYGVHHKVSHWREKVATMLDEGLRILEQEK
jgi:Phosphotransferase enzyme family